MTDLDLFLGNIQGVAGPRQRSLDCGNDDGAEDTESGVSAGVDGVGCYSGLRPSSVSVGETGHRGSQATCTRWGVGAASGDGGGDW